MGNWPGTVRECNLGRIFLTRFLNSTLLPSTHRLKKDMDDIAKGLKIAGTIGSMAIKAAKTIQDTIQTSQTPDVSAGQPAQASPPKQKAPSSSTTVPPQAQAANVAPQNRDQEAVFCDQCGARARSGKRFCNNCGAQLP